MKKFSMFCRNFFIPAILHIVIFSILTTMDPCNNNPGCMAGSASSYFFLLLTIPTLVILFVVTLIQAVAINQNYGKYLKVNLFLSAAPFIFIVIMYEVASLPITKVTLKVVDESGTGIEAVNADLRFGSKLVKGVTNSEGVFSSRGPFSRNIKYYAHNDGYYNSYGEYTFPRGEGSGYFGWNSKNPSVELVFKKKINPIPMYAISNMEAIKLPLEDEFIGYDLIKHDWVIPYGEGTHPDFLFKIEKHRLKEDDYHVTLTLEFSNESDGIQSFFVNRRNGSYSELRSPTNAPVTGYLDRREMNYVRSPGVILRPETSGGREDQNYLFRIRTITDSDGKIVSALYGKIYGNIRLQGFRKKEEIGFISFDYYLNPNSNDTNLEYNRKKNLFIHLSEKQSPWHP